MQKNKSLARLFVVPFGLWATIFIVLPLFFVLYSGLSDGAGHLTLANLSEIAAWEYAKSLLLSIGLALLSTAVCLALAYPLVLILRRVRRIRRRILEIRRAVRFGRGRIPGGIQVAVRRGCGRILGRELRVVARVRRGAGRGLLGRFRLGRLLWRRLGREHGRGRMRALRHGDQLLFPLHGACYGRVAANERDQHCRGKRRAKPLDIFQISSPPNSFV